MATLRGAAAEIVKSPAHRFGRLDIDGEVVRDPVIVVTQLGLQDADLVLGANFLRGHRVWLSYASHLVFVEPPLKSNKPDRMRGYAPTPQRGSDRAKIA